MISSSLDERRTEFRQAVGVSAVTGDGISDFFKAVEESRKEYEELVLICPFDLTLTHPPREYLPELQRMMAERVYRPRIPKAISTK